MTRRSSARLTPRTSVGKCGSLRAHCSSLSQNRFLLINPSPNTNQYRIVEPEGLMSSDPSRKRFLKLKHGSHIFKPKTGREPLDFDYCRLRCDVEVGKAFVRKHHFVFEKPMLGQLL